LLLLKVSPCRRKTSLPETLNYGFFLDIIPSSADPPNDIEYIYSLLKFSHSAKLSDSSQQAV
jgi:hypothetical protein